MKVGRWILKLWEGREVVKRVGNIGYVEKWMTLYLGEGMRVV